jgi:hypothetical protein
MLLLIAVVNKKSIKDYFLIIHKAITYTFRTIGSIGVIGILVLTTLGYSRHKYWEFTILSLVMLIPFLYFMFLFRIRYFFIGLSFCCSYLAFLHFTNFTDEKKLYALYKQITPNMSLEEFEALKESYFPNEQINKILKIAIMRRPKNPERKGDIYVHYWIRRDYIIDKSGETIATGDGLIITVNNKKITGASGPEFMD